MPNKTFRLHKAITELRDEALDYFTCYLPKEDAERGRLAVLDIIDRYGPVVDAYPYWHPLVKPSEPDPHFPATRPDGRRGFRGLDHTRFLRNAIITCPYSDKEVFASVKELDRHPLVDISAEPIDVPLYHANAKPILITCEWDSSMACAPDGTIPASVAVPLLLEMELPFWGHSRVAETWKTMHRYFLGQPCGDRSSLFVNEETGQTLKSIWTSLINTGMFGPIMVG